jgi:hypothetical protein
MLGATAAVPATSESALRPWARAAVKGALEAHGAVWLATICGLYALRDGAGRFVGRWRGVSIAALAATDDGLLVAHADGHEALVERCDARGERTGEVRTVPTASVKCLAVAGESLLVGGVVGVFRLEVGAASRSSSS